MEKDIPYIRVGLFVVIGIVMMASLGLFLVFKNLNTQDQTTYAILTSENTSGLTVGSPVKYYGMQVGAVSEIKVLNNDVNNSGALAVYIKVASSTPLNSSTISMFEPAGITGQLYVSLTGDDHRAVPLDKRYDGVLLIQSSPNMLKRYAIQLNELFKNVNSISSKVDKLLSEDNLNNITKTIDGIRVLIDGMNQQVAILTPTLKQTGSAMHQGENTLKDISQTAKSITAIADNINVQLKSGEFNLRPDIVKLRNSITKTSQDADTLIKRVDSIMIRMEMSPAEFIFDGANMQPGPGEESK